MKTFTHSVRIPALTDVPEMLGAYHTLFKVIGVNMGDLIFPPKEGFTHPIPQENEKMTSEFMGTMQVIQDTLAEHRFLKLINSRVQNTRVTFVFETLPE